MIRRNQERIKQGKILIDVLSPQKYVTHRPMDSPFFPLVQICRLHLYEPPHKLVTSIRCPGLPLISYNGIHILNA